MLGRLNHVGIATPSIERSIAMYRDVLGATAIGEPFDLPAQGVKVCFIDTPNTQIELIEPYDEKSPIAGYLRKNPAGGQHHVCFEVSDIDAAVADLTAKGATVLGAPADRRAWHADRVRPSQGYGRRAGRTDGDAGGGAPLGIRSGRA